MNDFSVLQMLGGALLGLALWVYIDGYSMAQVTKDINSYNYLLFFFMAVGAVMFIMGFLGCCGACQESQCMLATVSHLQEFILPNSFLHHHTFLDLSVH